MLRGDVHRLRPASRAGHEQQGSRLVGHVTREELWGIDDALSTALGLR